MAKRPADERFTERVAREMDAMYAAAQRDIAAAAARAFAQLADAPTRSAEFRSARAAALGREIDARVRALGVSTRRTLRGASDDAVAQALAQAEAELRAIGLDPANAPPSLAARFDRPGDDEAVRTLAEDAVHRALADAGADLERATRDYGRTTVAAFRSLSESVSRLAGPGEREVNRALARGIATGNPTIADRAVRELFRDPNSPERQTARQLGAQVVQVGGATLTVRQYAAIVTRTRTREAVVEARHRGLRGAGVRLVQITGRVSVNFCTAYLGLVCGLDGPVTIDGETYPALASLPNGGPPFHPQCSKGTAAYVVELVSEARREAHERARERVMRG
ncbi:MAG: hypothetical protein BroJett004_08000 [Planctomycetota bacterium]|nr:MAG: hypothetical protein BroJett004_08000 [Planctomycetota bacterium]